MDTRNEKAIGRTHTISQDFPNSISIIIQVAGPLGSFKITPPVKNVYLFENAVDVDGVRVLPEVLAFLLVARLLTARHLGGGLLRCRVASGSLLGAGHFSRAQKK